MGSRLLNGSPQLSVRVTLILLMLIVLLSTATSGTIAGTPVKDQLHAFLYVLYYIVTAIKTHGSKLRAKKNQAYTTNE